MSPSAPDLAGCTRTRPTTTAAVAENTTPLTEDRPRPELLTYPNTPTTQGSTAVTESTATITGTVDPSSNGQAGGA